ncbi:MAG: DUF3617 family protein [Xanthobacteraceae bacterium]
MTHRLVLAAAMSMLFVSSAFADGIDPGLWTIIDRIENGGVISPPHISSKCLTSDQTGDLATTFSPVATTVNSDCAPIERSLKGPLLTWHLVCKGQLNMDLSGEFNFDSPHHYTGTVHTKAEMPGMPPVDTQNTVEGHWVSACPQ